MKIPSTTFVSSYNTLIIPQVARLQPRDFLFFTKLTRKKISSNLSLKFSKLNIVSKPSSCSLKKLIMVHTHSFVELAEVQKETGTMYCAGLDAHPFSGGFKGNEAIYFRALTSTEDKKRYKEILSFYNIMIANSFMVVDPALSIMLASTECYLKKVVYILVDKCNVRVFKPQAGFYEQFGWLGYLMLSRIRQYIKELEKKYGRIIVLLDCKRGDISTTQEAYLRGLMDNLEESWGINYAPFDFDIINVTPWMGEDVYCIGNEQNPGLGLKLMREEKGIIGVNKISNPSGPQYTEKFFNEAGNTVQMQNVIDLARISKEYGLEYCGLSTIGLVVGSTHECDGSIRKEFPGATLLTPGFGAQGGKFEKIMKELINEGEWTGLGAIFNSARGSMYAFDEKFGGSGDVRNLESDLIKSTLNFRIAEKKAYQDPALEKMGIFCPFNN
jgi:orotidine 5'-phosphate decarboxylase subfamily 2